MFVVIGYALFNTTQKHSCSLVISSFALVSTVSCPMMSLQNKLWPTRRWGPDWRRPSRTPKTSLTNSCQQSSSQWTRFRTLLSPSTVWKVFSHCRLALLLFLSHRYGMRFISKVLKDTLHEKFPDATEDELLKVCIWILSVDWIGSLQPKITLLFHLLCRVMCWHLFIAPCYLTLHHSAPAKTCTVTLFYLVEWRKTIFQHLTFMTV